MLRTTIGMLGVLLLTAGCGSSNDTGPSGHAAKTGQKALKPLEPLAPLEPLRSAPNRPDKSPPIEPRPRETAASRKPSPTHRPGSELFSPKPGRPASPAPPARSWEPERRFAHRLGEPTAVGEFYIQIPKDYSLKELNQAKMNVGELRSYERILTDKPIRVLRGSFHIGIMLNMLIPMSLEAFVTQQLEVNAAAFSSRGPLKIVQRSEVESGKVGGMPVARIWFRADIDTGKGSMRGFFAAVRGSKQTLLISSAATDMPVLAFDGETERELLMTSVLTCRPRAEGNPKPLPADPVLVAVEKAWVGRRFMPKVDWEVWGLDVPLPPFVIQLPMTVTELDGKWARWFDIRADKDQLIPLEEAVAYYGSALAQDPRNVWLRYARGIALLETGKPSEALADFDEAIRHEKTKARIYQYRGHAQRQLREAERAIQDYTQAMNLTEIMPELYYDRACARCDRADFDEAIEDFSEYIRRTPGDATGYYWRSAAYHAKGDLAKCLIDLNKAVEVDPTYHWAYNNRAWLRATCQDEQYRDGRRAVEDAMKACELTEWKDVESVDTLAAAYAESGDFQKAIGYQQTAMQMWPDNAEYQAEAKKKLDFFRAGQPLRD